MLSMQVSWWRIVTGLISSPIPPGSTLWPALLVGTCGLVGMLLYFHWFDILSLKWSPKHHSSSLLFTVNKNDILIPVICISCTCVFYYITTTEQQHIEPRPV